MKMNCLTSTKHLMKLKSSMIDINTNTILALDISTTCIGVSIVYDDGLTKPNILEITHVSPKISKNATGIEALILRKNIFENDFLPRLKDFNITECVIEAPIMYAQSNSNYLTISELLQFNGLLSESIYRVLGIFPKYITTYQARMYSYPELMSLRKFKRNGDINDIKSIKKQIKDNHLTLFGGFPFDCDKKSIMMGCVDDNYPEICWSKTKSGELKKQNYDACDSLVCAIAYINQKRYGDMEPKIMSHEITENENHYDINYTFDVWGKIYEKHMTIPKDIENEFCKPKKNTQK